ncbi:MAG: CDP-diacylglycerol--glycerol-3-phosphate 3-phosphatidyltransferase [Ruminococcaceae bacterium]|nr:CDP-diacylglycerol--glycerol-3-phosphate 3-phosphatidyltransferase [Oscillospiraceae bacterium]
MNLPNKLTLARILMVPLYMVLLLWPFPFHYVAALAVFGMASLTDYFDGQIARSRNLVTNLGKFLDPIADKMLTTAAFLVFLAIGVTDVWAVMLVMTREFMVTSVRLMAAKDGTVVAASFSGKLKTVAQYVAIIAMMCALTWQDICAAYLTQLPPIATSLPILISQIFIWISVALTCISGVQYFWQFRHYFKEDC